MKRISIFLVILFAFSVTAAWTQTKKPSGPTSRPLVLYDDFNGPRIDPAKWAAIDWLNADPIRSDLVEMVRDLTPAYQGQGNNRFLRLFLRSYSANTPYDVDTTGGGFGLTFRDPAAIKDVAFTAVVNKLALTPCQNNGSPAVGIVEYRGRFFNSEGNRPDEVGDAEVIVGIYRNSEFTAPELDVYASINWNDPNQGWHILDSRPLGVAYLGQPFKLRVTWDQPNHQFIYRLNSDPESVAPYYIADTSLASGLWKGIWVQRSTPNCTTTPSASTTVDAYIDNVFVNPR